MLQHKTSDPFIYILLVFLFMAATTLKPQTLQTVPTVDLNKGKAFEEKKSGNAKLKVQFFWPFKGKYWIIDLADDYSYAVVSHPDKNYLWILSRTAKIQAVTYQQILSRLKEKGFDLTKIQLTEQS